MSFAPPMSHPLLISNLDISIHSTQPLSLHSPCILNTQHTLNLLKWSSNWYGTSTMMNVTYVPSTIMPGNEAISCIHIAALAISKSILM